MYLESIFNLDIEYLKSLNIKGFIIDIDNTLVEWDKKYASDRVVAWLKSLELNGFNICLVSNNTKDRVVKFNEELKLPAIHKAVKPRSNSFKKAIKIMKTNSQNTAVIGDQIFTDIFGGNRLNLYTILVIPMGKNELPWTRFVRKIERILLKNF